MKTSVYKKVHRDILLEWVYDDNNGITEPFSILSNNRERTKSYIGSNLTNNGVDYQLFPLDRVQNKYAKVDDSSYNFLSKSDYTSQGSLRHDQLNIRLPNNHTFGEYLGFHIRVYAYGLDGKTYDISNFFYNKNDNDQVSDMLGNIIPPILYEERLWDKNIIVEIPSVNAITLQLSQGNPISGSINQLLTNRGLSMTSPIFVDFHWISSIKTVGSEVQYQLTNPFSIEFSQSPQLEQLTLYAKESSVGDYFEIYPLYDGYFQRYLEFIESSKALGHVYYNEYLITIFEQDIKGKTSRFTVTNNFQDMVEWRPIIKYSTSSAIIDIEMRLIDKVDNSTIIRKAIYGMKPDQASKYALNLKKIKVRNINKPKIYVKNTLLLSDVDSITRKDVQQLTVTVNSPSLINLNNISAYSNNSLNFKRPRKIDNYFTIGRLRILIEPFDNIIRFVLAYKRNDELEFIDLTNCQDLKLSFKSESSNYEFGIYSEDNMNTASGMCSFRIPSSRYLDIKNLVLLDENLFYITTINQGVRTTLYTGQFSTDAVVITDDTLDDTDTSSIKDPIYNSKGIAIATKREVRFLVNNILTT